MDKDGPLPDVVDLEAYPNRTIGLGTWKAWKEGTAQRGKPDPYYEWLDEVKRDSTLDEANTRIEAVTGT
jgi:hypothetical protein